MYEIWDGELFLFSVDTEEEADTYADTGFRVVAVVEQTELSWAISVGSGPRLYAGTLVPAFLTFCCGKYILLSWQPDTWL